MNNPNSHKEWLEASSHWPKSDIFYPKDLKMSFTWKEYSEFRRSMCRPFPGPVNFGSDPKPSNEEMDFLNEAIHELVGEVSEMSYILDVCGTDAMEDEDRACLIDECGDILFCSDWVLCILFDDWYKDNQKSENVEIIDIDTNGPIQKMVDQLYSPSSDQSQAWVALNFCYVKAIQASYSMMIEAGLLCNRFKKLRYRKNKKYTVDVNVVSVFRILSLVNMILILVNSSVSEAMEINVAKLMNRYPTKASLKSAIGDIVE